MQHQCAIHYPAPVVWTYCWWTKHCTCRYTRIWYIPYMIDICKIILMIHNYSTTVVKLEGFKFYGMTVWPDVGYDPQVPGLLDTMLSSTVRQGRLRDQGWMYSSFAKGNLTNQVNLSDHDISSLCAVSCVWQAWLLFNQCLGVCTRLCFNLGSGGLWQYWQWTHAGRFGLTDPKMSNRKKQSVDLITL